MAKTELDHVSKVFADDGGDIVAVDDLSLTIDDGEFLVLVGPSGCGKSTTLRMVAGLETVTEGEIRLDGQVINDLPARDRDIAMVFQSYALYPHMTVRENMRFGLEESTDLPDDEIESRVERAAETMDIPDLLDRSPGELSGGQQQRVALGRAIVRDPAVFLLDEPLSNLDAKLRSQMRTELQRLQADLDTTTVYVTHDQTEAMTMGDRIAILNDGRLQQVGTPLACYHEPANLFVAGFVGEPSMNFLDVTLGDGTPESRSSDAGTSDAGTPDAGTRSGGTPDDGTRSGGTLVGAGFEFPISEALRADVTGHDSLVLGVRPEDVDLVGEVETDHDFPATVDVVEPMGDENQVHLRFGEGEDSETDGEELVATVSGMRRVEAGDRVAVRIPESAVHVFDRRTGEALRNRELETAETAPPNV